jgi:ferredoxin-NADP reductase
MAPTWRRYKIVRKEAETSSITSFYFQPLDGEPLAAFEAGHHPQLQPVERVAVRPGSRKVRNLRLPT